MQVTSHHNIYKTDLYVRTEKKMFTCAKGVFEKYIKFSANIIDWETLKNEGNSLKVCQQFSGISRATYYRRKATLRDLESGKVLPSKRPKNVNQPQWGESEKQLILRIRQKNPTYGKAKIAIIIKRDHGAKISESTVGRILKHLRENGLIEKSLSAARSKRKRSFNGHAKPCTFKPYKNMKLGERVQIDHMSVTKNGLSFKHFQGWERISKYIDADIYSNANSLSAKKFLLEFVANAPFKILSIQVDGGSEFMDEFEKTCKELGIELLVLPPASPKHNGGVERGNRIFREEFYGKDNLYADSLWYMQHNLKDAVKKYNSYRPHYALKGMTTMEYISKYNLGATQ